MIIRRWEDGEAIGLTDVGQKFRAMFHAPYYVIHRANFHEILHGRAHALGVDIKLGSKVEAYDAETPSVTLQNDQVLIADLIVAADGRIFLATRTLNKANQFSGINSKASKVVADTAEGPQPTGYAAYRATVKSESMRGDPDTAWLLEQPNINMWSVCESYLAQCTTRTDTSLRIGDHKHAMTYMISGGKTFNMVLAHKDNSDPALWTLDSARHDMEDHYNGWDPR
jgi:salicylate hydroxylase